MMTSSGGGWFFGKQAGFRAVHAFIVVSFLCGLSSGLAQIPPGSGGITSPTYTRLDAWSFQDHTNWTSDKGYAPISFANLGFSYLGNGASLVVNRTNAAHLQYRVVETAGTTNLTVNAGTVMFWFA